MPPTEKPKSATVTIDGRSHTLSADEPRTIIEVCDELGIEIPRLCYHKELTAPASCRMCLVEIDGAPRLQPACHTPICDGMVVHTNSERVSKARADVLELLLVNHPVDCPICDQAGECLLQDQYFDHDLRPSVSGPAEWKVKKGKAIRVGPRVTLDQERCILCTRCARFMDEIARSPQLGVLWRNDHAYVSAAPGRVLNSNYSLNTVAICPVGALTSTDFRFKKRVWEMETTPSICDGCARGCNSWIDAAFGRVYRLRARENEVVNHSWMCDRGLLSYGFINDGRLLAPRLGRGSGPSVGASLEAVDRVAARMSSLAGRTRKAAFLVSPRVSTEDALLAAWFVSEVMKGERLYVGGREEGEGDAILVREDRNPNRLGLLLAAEAFGLETHGFDDLLGAVDTGEVTALYGVGADVPTVESLAAEVFSSLEYLVFQASNHSSLTRVADVVLPAATLAEHDGTFINFTGRLQRFHAAMEPRGEAAPHWEWIAEVARQMGEPAPYRAAEDMYDALSARSKALGTTPWSSVGSRGVALEEVGEADDQTGGRSDKGRRGVSRWPR